MTEVTDRLDDVSERLIAGTVSLISAEGSSSLGVRRLAEAAGRSSMCIYSHFGSRGKLLEAVYGRVAAEFLTAVHGQGGEGYKNWATAHPHLYSLLLDHPLEALGVEQTQRTKLLAELVAQFSVGGWTQLHGEVSYSRIVRDAAQLQPSTA